MFRRGNIEDSQIVMIHNAASRLEADQIRELLEKEGIPVLLMDREDSGEDPGRGPVIFYLHAPWYSRQSIVRSSNCSALFVNSFTSS